MSQIIGRFEPFDSCHKAFEVVSLELSRFMEKPGYIGTKADGSSFHVFNEHWKWAPTWTGEGLPPVGVVCEAKHSVVSVAGSGGSTGSGGCAPGGWVKCTVIAHSEIGVNSVAVVNSGRTIGWGAYHQFRPIRTPEQIAAEVREKDCEEMLAIIEASPWAMKASPFEVIGLLYDANYRKFEIVEE